MENSIEEDIKNAEHFIKSIKTDKEYKEENGWHGYYNTEIVELVRMLEHILSEYKRVLKENEELKKIKEISSNITEEDIDRAIKEAEKQYISVQKVKDNLVKYQQEYELLLEQQSGKESNRTKYLRGRIHMCKELLEGRK